MKLNEVEEFLQSLIPELFSFSMALIPDELQAQQMVVDSIGRLILEDQELYVDDLDAEMTWQEEEIKKSLYKKIYSYIFELGKRRFRHLEKAMDFSLPVGKEAAFRSLDLTSRALLILKHKKEFNYDEIAEIINESRAVVISHLNLAREKMIRLTGGETYAARN